MVGLKTCTHSPPWQQVRDYCCNGLEKGLLKSASGGQSYCWFCLLPSNQDLATCCFENGIRKPISHQVEQKTSSRPVGLPKVIFNLYPRFRDWGNVYNGQPRDLQHSKQHKLIKKRTGPFTYIQNQQLTHRKFQC